MNKFARKVASALVTSAQTAPPRARASLWRVNKHRVGTDVSTEADPRASPGAAAAGATQALQHLSQRGFAVVDDALEPAFARTLRDEIVGLARRQQMYSNNTHLVRGGVAGWGARAAL